MPAWKPNYKQDKENVQLQQQTRPKRELPQLQTNNDDAELNESSCLLGTNRRTDLKGNSDVDGKSNGKSKSNVGVEALVTDTASIASDAATVFAAEQNKTEVKHEVSIGVKMTQCKSNMATIAEGGDTDLQLDSRKFPDDDNKNNVQNMNGSGVLLTPHALNTTTGSTNIAVIEVETENFNGSKHTDEHVMELSLPDEHTPKVWNKLVQKWPIISEQLALLVICALLWTIGSILLPEHAQPHTAIMRISLLIVGAQIAGVLVTLVHLPDMLGMLFFGVLYTNVGLADFTSIQPFEAFLREIALINIMLLVGIGLNADAFAKLWLMIIRLTLIPTIAEVLVITVIAHYTLSMPWIWGFLLGFVITAVSPNVIVSVLLELKERRLGLNKGIHTLIYAITACNDVFCIFCFGVVLQFIFTTSDLKEKIIKGPVGIGIGLVYGYLFGLTLQFIPSKHSHYVNGLRFVLTVLGGMIAVMGSRAIGYTSAGALGCVEVAFFARMGWKRDDEKKQQLEKLQRQREEHVNSTNIPNEDANEIEDTVAQRLDLLWKFLKPVSFALIGKEINFAVLDGKVVGFGVLVVFLGCLFRLAFAYISTFGGNLSRKERAYITISGFPKATVQAALGPLALDAARSLAADSPQLTLAGNVLIISVLAILLTAPLGAILMTRLAPHWLQHSDGQVSNGNSNADMMNSVRNLQQHQNKSQSELTSSTDIARNV